MSCCFSSFCFKGVTSSYTIARGSVLSTPFFQFFIIVCTLTVFFLRLILQVFKNWSQSYQGV
nr:MAG TPA: hypothetical protein [Caudoviricetes sp.]